MQAAAERSARRWKVETALNALIARPKPLFVALFVVFLLVYGASIFLVPKRYGRLIVGDGIYYYVYLRSVVLDGDLHFKNDYEIYQSYNNEDPIKKQEMLNRTTPIGMPANLFSVGPAVLWSPLFVLTHVAASALGQTSDGYAWWDEAPLMLLSMAYGFVGILLMYRVVAGMFSQFAAFVSILGIWLATNVVYYMGVSPSASHVLSLFASALFVYLWWRPYSSHPSPLPQGEEVKGRTRWDWFVWGLSAGLMTLVRWQDILIALLALLEWVATTTADRPLTTASLARRLPSALVDGLLFVGGLVLAFLPQMVAWQILYGAPLTAPQGGGFFQFLRPEILNVWFSTKRGLFSWTPIVLLAVLGLVPLYRKHRMLGAAAVVIFLLETYVNSIVNDWWGGEAFGARRFISLMPFFALGLAALIDTLRVRVSQTVLLGILLALIVWNNLFILQYNLWLHGIGYISATPTLQEMTLDKFTAPFKALEKWRGR
jgi:hypothetical protein